MLQPNEQIEHPHPPSDREAVADVTPEDRVHRRRNLDKILGMKEDFDEFLRVPGIDETQIYVHCLIDVALVAREKPSAFRRTIEHFVESVRGLFAREHGEENAAA